jgi:hypothetical protein
MSDVTEKGPGKEPWTFFIFRTQRRRLGPTHSLHRVLAGFLFEFLRTALAAEIETLPFVIDDRGTGIHRPIKTPDHPHASSPENMSQGLSFQTIKSVKVIARKRQTIRKGGTQSH